MHFEDATAIFQKSLEALKGNNVIVVGHKRPDGDCIGSQVALTRALNSCSIEAQMLLDDPVPYFLKDFIADTSTITLDEVLATGVDSYTFVTVDCAGLDRIPMRLYDKDISVALNIDHHISNQGYGEFSIVEFESAATAEILAALFFNSKLTVDLTTATALYVGMVTDSGQFSFPSTTSRLLELAGKLMELGVQPAHVSNTLYNQEPLERYELLALFLKTLKLEVNGRVCTGKITQEMYTQTNTDKSHTESFVDYARSIQGVEIAALVEETKSGAKASLRAQDPAMRVDLIAQEFGGGGHACAAGLSVNEPMDVFYPKLIAQIEKHLS